MITYVLWAMLVFFALYLVVAIIGPTGWERLLGMNLAATKIVVLIILFATQSEGGTSYLLDYAIVYALSGFIGAIFITLFWSAKQKGRKK